MRPFGAVTLALLMFAPLTTAGHIVDDLDEDVPWGCARRDCIPSIDSPTFDDGAWLADNDRVLGVELANESRAYAVRILNWHEIVNDEIAGTPVVVTYCPLCGTGLTFERTISSGVTTFGVSGRLYKNDLVMYDRETESLWSQELGEAIWGDLHAERLRFVPTATTTWGEWKRSHPDTKALARPDTHPEWRYDQYPYGDYESDADTLFPVENPSNQLHPKAWVLGVFTDNESVAFRQEDVERERVIHESLDGRELVVVWADGSPSAHWNGGGEPPRQVLGFWFAWHDFHPDTRLWGRLLAEVILPREAGGVTRVVFSEPVHQARIGAHVPADVTARWLDERVLELEGATPFTIPPGDYGRNGTALAEDLHVPLGRVQGQRDVPAPGVGTIVLTVVLIAAIGWRLRRRDLR